MVKFNIFIRKMEFLPEKLNAGRIGVGNIMHSIGKNPQPVNVKFTGKNTFD